MNIINIYENYNSYFNDEFKEIFRLCSNVALKSGHKLYLIGGIVRDMLLNQKSLDIDITVEGDAIEFASILKRECNAKILSVHKDFGTVKIEINGERIDFASTRSEIYPKKGHLPLVEKIGCSLEEDVLRRDFTINSLAISLNQDSFADLIDYVDGYEDLKNKKIKILHDKSFVDDPTRIIRALKYSTRLGFELDEDTLKLQNEYLKNVDYDMCNKRIKNELKKTFNSSVQEAFVQFIEQGIYKLITKKEINNQILRNAELVSASSKPKNPWLVYFGVIAVFEDESLLDKLELTKIEKNIILDAKNLLGCDLKSDFEIYKVFSGKNIESLLIYACIKGEEKVVHYLDNLEKTKLSINGNDLLELGFAPSRAFGDGFDYVLKEKLKNPNLSKVEELELIKKYLSEE